MLVRQRDRLFTFPTSPQVHRSVMVGDFGVWVGADTSVVPGVEIRPGAPISVTLFWRAVEAADRDYTIFVHAVGPDGMTWGQSDAWPVQGTAPTTTWVAGEVLLDPHSLTLREDAPPGAYELFVGVYDAQQGTRQPLYGEDGRLRDDRAPILTFDVASP
jgi:hypothetical protein